MPTEKPARDSNSVIDSIGGLDATLDATFDEMRGEGAPRNRTEAQAPAKKQQAKGESDGEPAASGKKPGKGFASFADASKMVGAEEIEGTQRSRGKKSAPAKKNDDGDEGEEDEAELLDDDDAKDEGDDEDEGDPGDTTLDDEYEDEAPKGKKGEKGEKKGSKGKDSKSDKGDGEDDSSVDDNDDESSEDEDDFDPFAADSEEGEGDDDSKVVPFTKAELAGIRASKMPADEINELLTMDPKARELVIRQAVRARQAHERSIKSIASKMEGDDRARFLAGVAGADEGGDDESGEGSGELDGVDAEIAEYAASTGQEVKNVRRFARSIAKAALAEVAPSLEALQKREQTTVRAQVRIGIVEARKHLIKQIPELKDVAKFKKVWDSDVVGVVARAYMDQGMAPEVATKKAIVERARAMYAGRISKKAAETASESRKRSLRETPDPGTDVKRGRREDGRPKSLDAQLDESFDEMLSNLRGGGRR